MIDLERAYASFSGYLSGFDRENEKIRLKIVHTDGVIREAKEIASRMNLDQEDVKLAELIALLHDIGRFEQIVRYDSFEPSSMDHAAYGVELLFGNSRMIRSFIEDDSYDEIIRTAIACHSDYKLCDITDEKSLLHAKLIRDADKLDNCRVKIEEDLTSFLGMDAKQIGKQEITAKVWESCLSRKAVLSADRKTKLDYWVSYIAYFYDINFAETCSIIRERDYVDRIINRITYEQPESREKMNWLSFDVKRYLNEMCDHAFGINKYSFYGWKDANVPALTGTCHGVYTPRDMYDILSDIWCADTCAPRMRKNWSLQNKTLGQCSITAFLVQDVFGGEVYGILRPGGNYHCYNVIHDCVFDLTSEQFGDEILDYTNNPIQLREDHFRKEEKYLRYQWLKNEWKRKTDGR